MKTEEVTSILHFITRPELLGFSLKVATDINPAGNYMFKVNNRNIEQGVKYVSS